jgi:putative oxidoreductase
MLKRLMQTDGSLPPLLMRLALGWVMLAHGLQKTIGAFDGYGFNATMEYLTQRTGLPYVLALLLILAESFGALGVLVGFLTRVGAFGILCVMLGAMFQVHMQFGFFMDWEGTRNTEGYEFHLLAVGLAAALLFTGGGMLSLDRKLTQEH